jgi:hypothetical protein
MQTSNGCFHPIMSRTFVTPSQSSTDTWLLRTCMLCSRRPATRPAAAMAACRRSCGTSRCLPVVASRDCQWDGLPAAATGEYQITMHKKGWAAMGGTDSSVV